MMHFFLSFQEKKVIIILNDNQMSIDHNTGGLLGYATRAAEGALIGGAFGSLLGLSPQHKQWARGIGAVCDALQGSKLFNAIGELL